MRRRIALASGAAVMTLIGILCLLLASWSPAMIPDSNVYPIGTTQITATFVNTLPGTYTTGEPFILEKQAGAGSWARVQKTPSGAFFNSIGYTLGLRSRFTFDLTKFCDGLTAGTYRIVKQVTDSYGRNEDVAFTFAVQ